MKLVRQIVLMTSTISTLTAHRAMAQLATTAAGNDTLRTTLAAPLSQTLVTTAVNRLYADVGYQPIFTQGGQLSPLAAELREAIQTLSQHGLPVTDYWTPKQEAYFTDLVPQDMTQVELDLARTYVSAAVHLNVGRVNPLKVAGDIKYPPKDFTRFADIKFGVTGGGIANTFEALAPQNISYRNLRLVLGSLRMTKDQGGFTKIARPKATLKVGSKSAIVPAIRARLAAYGYVLDSTTSDIYDAQLAKAVGKMQIANLTAATGTLPGDAATWEIFSMPIDTVIQHVEMTMEKYRWLPAELGPRFIFVNLATQKFYLNDPANTDPLLMEMNTINGQPKKHTPSMIDHISFLTFNPNWNVPSDHIFATEMLPKIQAKAIESQAKMDPTILAGYLGSLFGEQNFTLLDKTTNTEVPYDSVDWINLDPKTANFRMVQKPGYFNSLGVVKFSLTNPYDIYMHDTDDRSLFAKQDRLLSHGCIRLKNPINLAVYLLQGTDWDLKKIQAFVVAPGKTVEKETPVAIPKENRIPVYTMYATANVGADGVLRITHDYYNHIPAMMAALKSAGFYRTP